MHASTHPTACPAHPTASVGASSTLKEKWGVWAIHTAWLKIQWTFSIADTLGPVGLSIADAIGTQLSVLYREVSLIQRQFCTQLYVVGTAGSVLNREVSCVQGVFYWEGLLQCGRFRHEGLWQLHL